MNDLCAEIGYKSINHVGEQLCGDHVDMKFQASDTLGNSTTGPCLHLFHHDLQVRQIEDIGCFVLQERLQMLRMLTTIFVGTDPRVLKLNLYGASTLSAM